MGIGVWHVFRVVAEGQDPIRRIISGSSRAAGDPQVVGRARVLSTGWNRISFLQPIALRKYLSAQ
jgi:hypothetical protein